MESPSTLLITDLHVSFVCELKTDIAYLLLPLGYILELVLFTFGKCGKRGTDLSKLAQAAILHTFSSVSPGQTTRSDIPI